MFIKATCQAADAVGNFVRADSGSNAVTTVTCFQGYPAIGCIISKSSDTACIVQTYGLNGAQSGLTANSRYFVGPSGLPCLATALPSNAPYVQAVGFATQASQLFIQPSGVIYRRDASSPAPDPGEGDTVTDYYGGLLTGDGAPSSTYGRQNDVYLERDNGALVAVWGPKPTASDWGSTRVSLVGPAGGRIVFGHGSPPTEDSTIGPNDSWLDQDSGLLYSQTANEAQ